MKTKIVLGLGVAALLLTVPAGAHAQAIRIDIGVQFPGPPPLVVVGQGVQVVPEIDEEVFFVGGWYWVRRDDGWYRTRDARLEWYPAPIHVVPAYLTRVPPGHYRRYYRDDDGRWRPHGHDEYRAWRERHDDRERHEWWKRHRWDKRARAEQRRSWMDRRNDEPWHHRPPRPPPPPPPPPQHREKFQHDGRNDFHHGDRKDRKDFRREERKDFHHGDRGGRH